MEETPKEKSLQDEYLAGWQRERADFLNYKREEMERLKLFLGYATEDILLKLLPIVDNLEIADRELTEEQKKNEFIKGVLQIAGQLREFLKSHGVEEFKAEKEKFNPEFHEAVGTVEGTGLEPGIVAEVVKKGYTLQGKLLRPAKVKVAK
jgi:molecular chaperone GrpE